MSPPGLTQLQVGVAYARARRRRFADRAALQAWQDARLRRVLATAPRRYPYYRGLAPTRLTDLPVIDKATVVERFADLNEHGLTLDACLAAARTAERERDFTASLGGVSIGLSSGTSGRQSVFLTTPRERARWAGEVLAKALPDGLVTGTRVALVLRAGGPLYESVGTRRVSFRFVDLALPVEAQLTALEDFRPTVLAAPPSILRLVAQAKVQGRSTISPGRVLSVAEVLDPHDEREIEAGLGCRVDQIYQATEGFLGISCRLGALHLNEDLVKVERIPLDRTGRRFTPVITDLVRTSQAVLRLRLDDVLLAADDACGCGSPTLVVDEVAGRADDVLWLASAERPGTRGPLFADFVRGAVLGAPGVRDFRVVQTGAATVTVAVTPPAAHDGAASALRATVRRAGLVEPAVERADFTPLGPTEKLRRVRRDPSVPGGPAVGLTDAR
ncbi:F390 synthetase-related protein [Actinotalea subterranea]|uniref:F390 synthetase-related protein n=1 Tax=Actinotalea subterranea TaxID=2607497 RepID=UPI0011EF4E39|nr:F390 synthetase-related protein [Actinotalea subterranea]